MLNYVGRVIKKTGDFIVGAADSFVVKGASKLGANAVKGVFEGGAWLGNKAIKGVQKTAPKLKNIKPKKISDDIGKAVNKTMVGIGDDYKTIGRFTNETKIGKTYNKLTGKSLMDDATNLRSKHMTYVASKDTIGLVDTVTDRAKGYVDMGVGILKGDSWITGHQPLIKTGADNFMPFGIKATKLGVGVAAGVSIASGVPDAAKKWNDGRMGTNMDSQPVSVAPRTPAYANNGGATGDLVFALNNLRHGGMM